MENVVSLLLGGKPLCLEAFPMHHKVHLQLQKKRKTCHGHDWITKKYQYE
jgi:hypothetical protein